MVVFDMPPCPGAGSPRGPFCIPLRTSRSPILILLLRGLARRSRPIGARDAGVSDDALHGKTMPNDKYDYGADRRADKPCALVGPVPANALADRCREERAGNSQDGG